MTQAASRRFLYWKTIDRLQAKTIERMSGLVLTQLILDKRRVATAVGKVSADKASEEAARIVFNAEPEWKKLYVRIYVQVMAIFAQRVVEQFEKSINLQRKEIDEATLERWAGLATEYVELTAAARIPKLLSNTNKIIQSVISDGIKEGKGIDEISSAIRKHEPGFNKARAVRVARTEVISASNLGTLEGGLTVDPEMKKEWIATNDDKTRESHMAADGQVQNIKEPFDVGGFKLMFPGDTSLGAPPSETVNERCTIGFLPVDKRELTGAA